MTVITDNGFARITKETLVRDPNTSGAITGDEIAYNSTTTVNERLDAVTGDVLNADQVINTPSGGISSTDVQGAINELDSETVHKTGNESISGTKTFSGLIEFAAALGKKISFYGTNYFLGIQANLLQIGSESSTTRTGIGYGTTGAFTETLTVKGGNVGIGQIAPGAKLTVETSTASASRIRITETGDTTDAQYSGLELYDGATFKGGLFKSGLSHNISIWTASQALTILASNNNVGINNTAPARPLVVQSSTADNARVRATETGDTSDTLHFCGFEMSDGATFKGGLFKTGASHNIVIYTTSVQAITILQSNANVGIGNTAPSEKLDVTGNIKSSGTVEAANTSGFKLGASATIKFNTTSSSIDFIIT